MGRPPCCDKSNVKRGLRTPEEDANILAYVSTNGIGNWTIVPKKAGLNRCGKSCRLRWTNYLRPDLKHDGFTPQEEELIINLHQAIGSRWSLIAKQLPGRTDNDVKNYWNTKLRKKLSKLGIDPLTHKPFSLVLSDYGNISGLQNTETQINVSPNKNKNCTFMPKPEPPSIPTGFTNTEAPIRRPVVEQVQTGFSNEIIASWDSPSQFQLISQEPIFQPLFNETTSFCSSTASSNLIQLSSPPAYSCQPSQAEIPLSSSFNWGEFILSDPLTYPSFQQQQDIHFQGVLSPSEPPTLLQTPSLSFTNGNGPNGHEGGLGTLDFGSTLGGQTKTRSEATSSVSSFVEAILEQDSEMRAEFPDILDESFGY